MAVVRLDGLGRDVVTKEAAPFVEAAPGRGARILGIERQEHDFVAIRRAQLFDCFSREGMPVAHGHETVGVDAIGPELLLERIGLLLGEAPDGRGSSDGGIVVLHFLGTRGGNQSRQGLASQAGKREINDIGVAKEIKKEGLNRLRRVRAAELKENYS